jgi:hypothetical protein
MPNLPWCARAARAYRALCRKVLAPPRRACTEPPNVNQTEERFHDLRALLP